MSGVDVNTDVHWRKGPTVDVGAIEQELAQLWRMPTVVGLRDTDIVPTRTSVLNLVVHSSDQSIAKRTSTIINELAANHPSRVITFTSTSELDAFDDDIDAHVSTHCHTTSGERFASCYEKIEIASPPDSLDELPSLIVALAIPDLPTFVWWPGQPPLDDRRFRRVALAANRLIVDSLDFEHCATNMQRVAELCSDVAERCVLSDLNWARLTPWRSMMSQFFDMSDCRWALDHVTALKLEYGHSKHLRLNAAQALLFAGWLASRLGWTSDQQSANHGERGICSTQDTAGNKISIEMVDRVVPSHFNGFLLGATLIANDGQRSGKFEVSRIGDDLTTVKMTATLAGHVIAEHAMRSAPTNLSKLLLHELENTMPERLYQEALAEADHFASIINFRRSS